MTSTVRLIPVGQAEIRSEEEESESVELIALQGGSLGQFYEKRHDPRLSRFAGKRCQGSKPDGSQCTTRIASYNHDAEGLCFVCQRQRKI